ncbi:hypothetical protein Angca_008131, partial [Angiostrongylus cantonensis]
DMVNDTERRGSQHKQPTLVAKRNARERTRVRTVNQAFIILKFHLPSLRTHTKRVSKLKILNAAICYIHSLVSLLQTYDDNAAKALHRSERHYGSSAKHSADRSLIQHQSLPYMKSLLDHPPYLCTQKTAYNSQSFVVNHSTSTLLFPPSY